jgi:hypothetical protein
LDAHPDVKIKNIKINIVKTNGVFISIFVWQKLCHKNGVFISIFVWQKLCHKFSRIEALLE